MLNAMPTVWFAILAGMLTTYVVLDGFDLGAGVLHFLVAKNETQRRVVLAAIGPFWDGNEVWFIAAGGVFVFAFPQAYAAAFSGLYLPLMVVLWLVILRGLSIEFRSQLEHPLWRRGFDVLFAGSSAAITVVLGVALGNVIRGVPLDTTGYFHEDLFGGERGALDLYTSSLGLFALVSLGAHAATFLAWKTDGEIHDRATVWASRGYRALLCLVPLVTLETSIKVHWFLPTLGQRVWLWPLPLVGLGAAVYVLRSLGDPERSLRAFLASCLFHASLLLATAGLLFPVLLRSTLSPAFTLYASSPLQTDGLRAGLALWALAVTLVVGYFVLLFRSFRGKALPADH